MRQRSGTVRRRWAAGLRVAAAAAWLAFAGAGAEARAEAGPFAGVWQGETVALPGIMAGAGLLAGDFDVTIASERNGFTLQGTLPIIPFDGARATGTTRAALSLAFDRSRHAGVFQLERAADPLARQALAWARLAGDRLTLYRAVLTPTGGFAVHQWTWTLTEPGRATFRFSVVTDHHDPLVVEGTILRVRDR